YSDCSALSYLLHGRKKELNARMARYAFTLLEYDIVAIKHVKGIHNTCADFLSRYPTEDFDPSRDELPELPLLHISLQPIQAEQERDAKLAPIIDKIKRGRVCPAFTIKSGVLYHRDFKGNKCVIA